MAGVGSRTVIGRVHKVPDVETHVRHILVDGRECIEVRDYIISLGEYTRGYMFPRDREVLMGVIRALTAALPDE